MKTLIIFLFFVPFLGFSQERAIDFPKDTTFNVKSAARKIASDFPQAVPVGEYKISAVKEKRELVYHSFGERKLHLDIFYPEIKKRETVPGVLLIHGGGWASGSKSHLIPMAQKLAENGYVAASVEYRLSPEARYPAGIIDLKTAIKWLKINATEFGIDTSRIVTLGTSAGATLASLLGTTAGCSLFPSHAVAMPVSDAVHAIVNIDGALDFTNDAESGKDEDPARPSAGARWFGYTYKQKPELWVEASPVNYVCKNTPPTIFINSSLPRFHVGRDQYIEVLNANNIYNEVHTIAETPHPFWLFQPWFDETVPLIVDFLDQVFKE
ncbi:alpha/beta hydrolase fold domain-containing protein [Mangrovibacterium sp.]|uniref:alpha/beta hydrolase fold domain-containing protein n=1 Tax=Mangrovibacterium sp. TaxID=1961364 RepID=UPI0035646618